MSFASLSSGTSTPHKQMLILKLAHNWMVILQMENWLVLVQNFSVKHFLHWRMLICPKQNHGDTSVSILLFSWRFPKSGLHASIAVQLQRRRSHSCCSTLVVKLNLTLRKENCPVMWWRFSSTSSRVRLQTELTYLTLIDREGCMPI